VAQRSREEGGQGWRRPWGRRGSPLRASRWGRKGMQGKEIRSDGWGPLVSETRWEMKGRRAGCFGGLKGASWAGAW
jgi:hypothetical protein